MKRYARILTYGKNRTYERLVKRTYGFRTLCVSTKTYAGTYELLVKRYPGSFNSRTLVLPPHLFRSLLVIRPVKQRLGVDIIATEFLLIQAESICYKESTVKSPNKKAIPKGFKKGFKNVHFGP